MIAGPVLVAASPTRAGTPSPRARVAERRRDLDDRTRAVPTCGVPRGSWARGTPVVDLT